MSRLIFDASRHPPQRQFEAFHGAVATRLMRVRAEPPAGARGFPARLHGFRLGERAAHLIEAPGHRCRRGPDEIRRDGRDELHLTLMLSGRRRLAVGEESAEFGPGEMFVTLAGAPFELPETPGAYRALTLGFPARLLSGRDAAALLRPGRLAGHRLSRALEAAAAALAEGMRRASDAELAALLGVVECLLDCMLRGERPATAAEARAGAAYGLIALEIDRGLGDPQFDLATLSRRVGLSARCIQRALAERGQSFSELLRRRRLELARHRLATSGDKIQNIAGEVGYSELSAFYRAFRRAYGCAPGDLRA